MKTGFEQTASVMSIGELSAATGCSPESIRYYEKQGLLPTASRTSGGHRQYGKEQHRLLMFILRARQLGFSQPDVRRLLKMADPSRTECEVVRALARDQLKSVQGKMRTLRRLERSLKALITDCETEGATGECPMIESLLDETWTARP